MTAGTCVLFDHFQRRKSTAPLKAAREKLFLLSAVFSLSLAFATLSFVSDRRRLVRASESSSTAAPSRRGARPPGCRWRGRRANGRRTARPDRDIDRAPGVARGQGGQQARTLLPGSTQSGVAAAVGEPVFPQLGSCHGRSPPWSSRCCQGLMEAPQGGSYPICLSFLVFLYVPPL